MRSPAACRWWGGICGVAANSGKATTIEPERIQSVEVEHEWIDVGSVPLLLYHTPAIAVTKCSRLLQFQSSSSAGGFVGHSLTKELYMRPPHVELFCYLVSAGGRTALRNYLEVANRSVMRIDPLERY